jgi:plastocyanin
MRSFAQPAGLLLVLGVLGGCGSGSGGTTGPIPTQLAFTVEPGTIIERAPFNPAVKVEFQDANGALVTGSTATIRVHLKAGGGNGSLTGTLSHAAVGGVVTFTNLSVDQAGDYILVAVSDGVDSAFTGSFTVNPTPPPPTAIEVQVGSSVGAIVFRSVRNNSQNPAIDTLAAGGTVTWNWLGNGHSVHSTGTPFTSSGTLNSPATYDLVFNTPGTYTYNCGVHGNAMTGRIEVQ